MNFGARSVVDPATHVVTDMTIAVSAEQISLAPMYLGVAGNASALATTHN
jgi:hypothetical protein